jgi:FlaA1/EpsC-like NDP-sugar epimerase
MARGGDVFVLDMGEPVRIQDLAKRMIRLMGRSVCDEDNPDGDIEISYIGLRPAEKLYEELLVGDDVSGTEHPRIMRAVESFEPFPVLIDQMRELNTAIDNEDCDLARELLLDIVKIYHPTNGIGDLVWNEKQRAQAADAGLDNVTHLASR